MKEFGDVSTKEQLGGVPCGGAGSGASQGQNAVFVEFREQAGARFGQGSEADLARPRFVLIAPCAATEPIEMKRDLGRREWEPDGDPRDPVRPSERAPLATRCVEELDGAVQDESNREDPITDRNRRSLLAPRMQNDSPRGSSEH